VLSYSACSPSISLSWTSFCLFCLLRFGYFLALAKGERHLVFPSSLFENTAWCGPTVPFLRCLPNRVVWLKFLQKLVAWFLCC
jgi:hypothetical protein